MKFKHIDGSEVLALADYKSLQEERVVGLNLSSVNFKNTTLRDSEFIECTFSDCNFWGSDLSQAKFYNCNFINSELYFVKTYRARLHECFLEGCKFDEAKLNCSLFENCEITESQFHFCNLTDTSFLKCDISDTNFCNSTVLGTVYFFSNLNNIDFSYVADWHRVRMGNAELKNVKFPEVGHFAANEQETWDERRRNGGA